ncbi:hypothetical protein EMIT0210MI2_30128 [Priestia megaterium]
MLLIGSMYLNICYSYDHEIGAHPISFFYWTLFVVRTIASKVLLLGGVRVGTTRIKEGFIQSSCSANRDWGNHWYGLVFRFW